MPINSSLFHDSGDVNLNLHHSKHDARYLDVAMRSFQRAIALSPNKSGRAYGLSLCLSSANQVEEAMTELRVARTTVPRQHLHPGSRAAPRKKKLRNRQLGRTRPDRMRPMKSIAALFGLVAILQQTPVRPAQQHVQKVVLNVTDNAGRFILNLKQQDFIVEENGMEQKITGFLEGSDVPVSLGILIDKSTSMRLPLYVQGKEYVPAALLAATRIGRAVVKLMKPQDEFLLMTFDEKVQVKQNFTQDRKKVEDQLEKLNEVGNATHLYDSVVNALEKMKKAKYKRRALIVITDAYDTSGKQLDDLRPRIAEQEIQVFTCGLRSVYRRSAGSDGRTAIPACSTSAFGRYRRSVDYRRPSRTSKHTNHRRTYRIRSDSGVRASRTIHPQLQHRSDRTAREPIRASTVSSSGVANPDPQRRGGSHPRSRKVGIHSCKR